MMAMQQQEVLMHFALDVIEGAGEIARRYFRSSVTIDNKNKLAGFDPVTVADREVEAYIRHKVAVMYPEHSILGEEQGFTEGTAAIKWVIDPIDGTRAFISGSPLWGILIGIMENEQCLLGLMHQPYLQETFSGSSAGAFIHKAGSRQAIATSATQDLGAAILYCTHPSMFTSGTDLDAFHEVAGKCRLMRYGGDCYAYCLLAYGLVDLVIEGGLQPYDIIPLIPLIEAAGGMVTDWQGNAALAGGNVIAAANTDLHTQALALLKIKG